MINTPTQTNGSYNSTNVKCYPFNQYDYQTVTYQTNIAITKAGFLLSKYHGKPKMSWDHFSFLNLPSVRAEYVHCRDILAYLFKLPTQHTHTLMKTHSYNDVCDTHISCICFEEWHYWKHKKASTKDSEQPIVKPSCEANKQNMQKIQT